MARTRSASDRTPEERFANRCEVPTMFMGKATVLVSDQARPVLDLPTSSGPDLEYSLRFEPIGRAAERVTLGKPRYFEALDWLCRRGLPRNHAEELLLNAGQARPGTARIRVGHVLMSAALNLGDVFTATTEATS